MAAPSSPPTELSPPPGEASAQEQLWSSLFPKPPASTPPAGPGARPPGRRGRRFERARARFWRSLPGFFDHLGTALPALIAAVLTGVLLGYLLGVTREGIATSGASVRQGVADDRHQRDLVRVKAAAEQELAPARSALEEARAQADDLRELTTLYEGFRTAQRALRTLESRHYGDAEATLREAARQLAPLASKVDGLPAVLSRLQRAQLATAIDLNSKRQALLTTLAQLDALIAERQSAVAARAGLSDG